VLTVEVGGQVRQLDAETDLFPLIDWSRLDLDGLAARLPKDARGADTQAIRLRTGTVHGVETENATEIVSDAPFDAAYAVRMIGDIVPNGFAAWALVDRLLAKLRSAGWDDALFGRLAAFLIDELRKELVAERERQAPTLFRDGLATGAIQFAVRGDGNDWRMPDEVWTTQPDDAAPLQTATYQPLERSLFLPIYAGDLNDSEQKFAVYLDRDDAVRWWHRNGTMRGSYGLRGWRRGNVYPDFLFAALKDKGGRERIVVVETKGEQLEGNRDTEYKRALLDTLSGAFSEATAKQGELGLTRNPFDFRAAVVLFDEIDARLPALIRGEPGAENGV
jgi:type III restriction enzyme